MEKMKLLNQRTETRLKTKMEKQKKGKRLLPKIKREYVKS